MHQQVGLRLIPQLHRCGSQVGEQSGLPPILRWDEGTSLDTLIDEDTIMSTTRYSILGFWPYSE
jgi:hypothetical protein